MKPPGESQSSFRTRYFLPSRPRLGLLREREFGALAGSGFSGEVSYSSPRRTESIPTASLDGVCAVISGDWLAFRNICREKIKFEPDSKVNYLNCGRLLFG